MPRKDRTRPRRVAAKVEYQPNPNPAVVDRPHMLATCRGECRLTDLELADLIESARLSMWELTKANKLRFEQAEAEQSEKGG
jgi:hypothetical protein